MAEENNKDKGNPSELPENNPKDGFVEIEGIKYKEDPNNKGQPLKDEQDNPVPFQEKRDDTDYKVKLEEEREAKEKIEEESKKKDIQLKKAGFNIEKLKKRLKDEGIEIEEESLTGERVSEIIQSEIKSQLGELRESFKKDTSEILRTLTSKGDKNKPGGGGGQKLPEKEGTDRPVLSTEDESVIKRLGGKWDRKKVGWTMPSGRFYPFDMGRPLAKQGLPAIPPNTPPRKKEE